MMIGQISVPSEDINVNENCLEKYLGVKQLGIQAPQGTIFKINNGSEITISEYGIYELDLSQGEGVITSLVFTSISSEKKAYVDIVYEEEVKEVEIK